MRQTLFFIPHELFGIPVFGFGWALGGLLVVAVVLFLITRRTSKSAEDFVGLLPVLVIAALAAYALLPMLEVKGAGPTPLGLPIRGYGVFVLLGIVAGVGLTIYRVRQIGMDEELIYSLALWLFVFAIPGARLFYIVQYWQSFARPTVPETLLAMLKFTEGGIVVYGAVMGGMLALYFFSRKHAISMLELGDVIAPGMALGLALGRIGCLMNGCCYGGVCEASSLAVTFPQRPYPEKVARQRNDFSPPYGHQLANGDLYGFQLGRSPTGKPIVLSVAAGGPAEQAGVQTGVEIATLNGKRLATPKDARKILATGPQSIYLTMTDGSSTSWGISLPPRSLPTHPTQIYSSINALVMCLVVWFLFPFRRHRGEVLLVLLVMYSCARFLLEAIRSDEVGQLGTPFTISQLVSMIVLVGCAVALYRLQRQPPLASSFQANA